jgi:hypothetical protein
MWPTVETYIRLSSLHQNSGKSGIVTSVGQISPGAGEGESNDSGGNDGSSRGGDGSGSGSETMARLIRTIDHRPAAEVSRLQVQ